MNTDQFGLMTALTQATVHQMMGVTAVSKAKKPMKYIRISSFLLIILFVLFTLIVKLDKTIESNEKQLEAAIQQDYNQCLKDGHTITQCKLFIQEHYGRRI